MTTTTTTTHYELLDVPPQSSFDDIRRAYHRAARQHHPDKRSAGTSSIPAAGALDTSDTSTKTTATTSTDAAFVLIQEAYETLRDPVRRSEYDAQLLRNAVVRKRDVEQVRVADVVSVREMTREVLSADKDDGDNDDGGDDGDETIYSYPCRCGDVYEVSEDELLDGVEVVPCNGCSLNIRVLLQTP